MFHMEHPFLYMCPKLLFIGIAMPINHTPRQRRISYSPQAGISCGLAAIHTAGTAVFLTRVSVYFIEGANATDCRHGALINIQG